VSGYEHAVRDRVRAVWEPLTTAIQVDQLGSLWATQAGSGPAPRHKIMLAAHMDVIGLMVTQIEGDFLRVTPIGGVDARGLPGQLVTVHGRRDLPGVAAQPAAWLLPKENREGVVPVTECLVDTGLPAKTLRTLVAVGDVISFAQPPGELQNDLLTAPHLDNRAALVALGVALEQLQSRRHRWDVIAVATTQEEVGARGALAAAFALQPQLALAIDVTYGLGPNSKDFPDKMFALNGGPTLGLGPNIHPRLRAALQAAADRLEMSQHSGTDAFTLQIARAGLPTAVIGLPLRNMHSPVEVIAVKDIYRAGRLLAEFIAGLDAQFMQSLGLD
jgi:endoglucanase